MDDWILRNQEESYLSHLEQLVVRRLKNEAYEDLVWSSPAKTDDSRLNPLSWEMNRELDRLENLVAEELKSSRIDLE